jgi:hypothetical protein
MLVITAWGGSGKVAVAKWQWQFDSGSGCSGSGCSGKVVVAVAGWQCGRVAGEKMERIGPVLRELCVFVAVAVVVVTVESGSGRVAVQFVSDGLFIIIIKNSNFLL